MTSQANSSTTQASLTSVVLEKEDYHLRSPRLQMVWMTLILLIVCVVNYLPTLPVGLLQHDYERVKMVVDATHGQWHEFWQSTSPPNTCKALGSFSLLFDRIIWHSNYAGFHFTNILLVFFCACLVMLITLEITGAWGNRSRTSAALWSGLLFCVYPLHAETVSWLGCRDDLISSLLFLQAVYCFFKFRLVREKKYFSCFLLFVSLLCLQSNSALVLPVVISSALILIPTQLQSTNRDASAKIRRQDCNFAFACLFISLVGVALRSGLPETGFDLSTVSAWWQSIAAPSLFDLDSWKRIILPLNADLQWPGSISIFLICPLILAAVSSILRLSKELSLLFSLTFLAGWLLLGRLPDSVNYHIYSNLMGSNLFFLASAPWCILLAIASIPSVDVISRKAANIWTCIGVPSLLMLFLVWSYALQQNLKPFIVASEIIHHISFEQMPRMCDASRNGIVILDLPHDYKGAPVLTRESFKASEQPPFFPQKETFSVVDTITGQKSDYVWPDEIKRALEDQLTKKTPFCWSKSDQSFVPLNIVRTVDNATVGNYMAAALDPPTAWTGQHDQWHLGAPQNPGFETYPTYRRLIPAMSKSGRKPPPAMTVMIPVTGINPFDQTAALINIQFHGDEAYRQKCHFIWRSKDPGANAQPEVHEAPIDKNIVWLGHYKQWLLNSPPTAIGFKLEPGPYCVDVGEIQLVGDASLKPVLLLDNQIHEPAEILTYSLNLQDRLMWGMPMSLKDCHSVMYVISKPDQSSSPAKNFDTASGGTVVDRIVIGNITGGGQIRLSQLNVPLGLSQIQVIALDKNHESMGLPSEPLTILR